MGSVNTGQKLMMSAMILSTSLTSFIFTTIINVINPGGVDSLGSVCLGTGEG